MKNQKKYSVFIEYCSECNYEKQAIQVSDDLLSSYQHVIDNVTIKTGSKGIFNVKVNGKMIFSKYQASRHADTDEVLEAFKKIVGPEVPVYPQSS